MNSIDFNEDFYKKKYLKYKAKYLKLIGGFDCTRKPTWKDLPILTNINIRNDFGITRDNQINYNDLSVFYNEDLNRYKVVTIEKNKNFLNVFDIVYDRENKETIIEFINIKRQNEQKGRNSVAFISFDKFIMADTENNQLVEMTLYLSNLKYNNAAPPKIYNQLPLGMVNFKDPKNLKKPRCVAVNGDYLYVIDEGNVGDVVNGGRFQMCNLRNNKVSQLIDRRFKCENEGDKIGLAVSDMGKICVSKNNKLFKVVIEKEMRIEEILIKNCGKTECIGMSHNIAFNDENTICIADYTNKQILLVEFSTGNVICPYELSSPPISIACANNIIFVCLENNNILKFCSKQRHGYLSTVAPPPAMRIPEAL
jgi:hypothetical protein